MKPAANPTPTASAVRSQRLRGWAKGRWRRMMSLSIPRALTGIVVLATLIATATTSAHSLKLLYDAKLEDSWTILFLETERFAADLTSEMARIPTLEQSPDARFRVGENGRLTSAIETSEFPKDLDAKSLGFTDPLSIADQHVVAYGGETFLAKVSRGASANVTLNMWRFDLGPWLQERLASQPGRLFYLATREGQLIFASNPDVTTVNFVKRPLVQNFINSPLKRGQFAMRERLREFYGTYYEIPGANLVLFSETEKAAIFGPLDALARRVGIFTLIVLALMALVLQAPLTSIAKPLRELAQLVTAVGQGNYSVRMRSRGLGELAQVGEAFDNMAQSLVSRNETIAKLMADQRVQFRLESELSMAKEIQSKLLPSELLPAESGLEISSFYKPAAEVAGDWYDYFYNPETGESVVAMADVAGHGAGSSLFTAVIAGMFAEFCNQSKKLATPFARVEFAHHLDQIVRKIGRSEWHVTLTLVAYDRKVGAAVLMNAGHTFPILVRRQDGKLAARRVRSRSTILGVGLDLNLFETSIPLNPGDGLLLYTDGLTEASSPAGRPYGLLNAERIIASAPNGSASDLVDRVYADMESHVASAPLKDDVCIVSVRRAA